MYLDERFHAGVLDHAVGAGGVVGDVEAVLGGGYI